MQRLKHIHQKALVSLAGRLCIKSANDLGIHTGLIEFAKAPMRFRNPSANDITSFSARWGF
ncbi:MULTISPECIES: hypothetical protein [unclassified Pseudomonas]|uniref:hypothetical protein n=1 Tax=unclassified Pseudomonas TaxID=196821 RepID=UPI001E43F844|nr:MULTISPECIES: hypothetical protein [unclassified Pseudomonas]